MQLSTATPAEIDTEIARLENQRVALQHRIAPIRERYDIIGNALHFPTTDADKAVEIALGGREPGFKVYHAVQEQLDLLESERGKCLEALTELVDEYTRRGGWTRYYVVDNHNGHLHTTRACQNTYETTSWVWMTSMSGMTAAEAVEQGGKLTCLTCFPGFREEIEAGREPKFETPRMKVAREEREAAAAKKAAEKDAKGITNPDGTPLMQVEDTRDGGWRETTREIKTIIAAQRAASQAAYDLYFYNIKHPASEGEDHPQTAAWYETVRRCTEALAARLNQPVEEIGAEIEKKVKAKYRREYRDSFAH